MDKEVIRCIIKHSGVFVELQVGFRRIPDSCDIIGVQRCLPRIIYPVIQMPATVLVSIEQHFLMIPFQEYALPLVLSIQQKINHLFRTGSSVDVVSKKDVNSISVGMQSFP